MAYLKVTSDLDVFSQYMIAKSLNYFNGDKEKAEELAEMLLPSRKGVSLRLADHLVVQYSRDNDLMIPNPRGGPPIQLWNSYRRTLVVNTKKYFDVFKRKNIIKAVLLDEEIESTVGQIVFLAWYSEKGLVDFMNEHQLDVRKHMQSNEQKTRKRIKSETVKMRKPRAPSRSESVKPKSHQFTGEFMIKL